MVDRGEGGIRDAPFPIGPISFIFMQFSSTILSNNRLVPPLENPRSATKTRAQISYFIKTRAAYALIIFR